MANRTAWVAGLGEALSYGTALLSADMNGMTNGQTVMSNNGDITNGTSLDIFADISYALLIASSSVVAGANFAFWIYNQNQDGSGTASHYGDGQLSTFGTPATITPVFSPCGTHGVPVNATTTNMYGTITGIIIPPGTFRFAIQNNCGFTLSGTQTVMYRTYNLNLNS